MTQEKKRTHLWREEMAGTAVTQKPPILLTLLTNQVQATGAMNADDEVVQKKAVTKDMAGKADASTAQNKHHQSETSRYKLTVLAQY